MPIASHHPLIEAGWPMTEEWLITEDGLRLRRRTWIAGDKARGIVAIAHGYGEYAGRYDWVAARLKSLSGQPIHFNNQPGWQSIEAIHDLTGQ